MGPAALLVLKSPGLQSFARRYRQFPMPALSAVLLVQLAPRCSGHNDRLLAESLPARAAASEQVVYRGRNVLVRIDWLGEPVVVKCFPRRRGAIKARKAFAHALKLQELGLGTPPVYAAVEGEDGAGWFACAWIADCRAVWDLHDRVIPDSDRHCRELGAFVGRMHQAGAHHRDLTPGNILLAPKGESFAHQIVDHNRMSFGPIGALRGLAALVKLECQGRTLHGYCQTRGLAYGPALLWFRMVWCWHRGLWAIKNSTRPLRRWLRGRR